eukprot:SAG11_NODE_721_length_7539_cov_32.292473_6_plen_61_part_00
MTPSPGLTHRIAPAIGIWYSLLGITTVSYLYFGSRRRSSPGNTYEDHRNDVNYSGNLVVC